MRYIVVVLFLAFDASVAFGMVYSWIDAQKIRHFVNKEYDIPERYRAKVKALYPEQSDARMVSPAIQEQEKAGRSAVIAQPEVTHPAIAAPAQVPAPVPVAASGNVGTVNPTNRKRRDLRSREESD